MWAHPQAPHRPGSSRRGKGALAGDAHTAGSSVVGTTVSRPGRPVAGVAVTVLSADGRVVAEWTVGIMRHVPLTLQLPDGERLRLEGIDDPRVRVVLGPVRRVVRAPNRGRRWRLGR